MRDLAAETSVKDQSHTGGWDVYLPFFAMLKILCDEDLVVSGWWDYG